MIALNVVTSRLEWTTFNAILFFMKLFGVTGGIGSGKSMICEVLKVMNFPVYSSDERAKYLQNNDPEVIREITALFGPEAYHNHSLNTRFLSNQIFTDNSLRLKLNAIVHPRVKLDFESWLVQQKSPCVFQESALIYEIGRENVYDAILLVTAPIEVRINRVIDRDGVQKEEVLQRMNKQLSDEEKRLKGPVEIVNDGEQLVLPQLISFLTKHTCINL